MTNDLDESFWAVISSETLEDDEDEDEDDDEDDDDGDVELDSAIAVEHLNANSPVRVGTNELHDSPLEEYFDILSNAQLNDSGNQIEFIYTRNPPIITVKDPVEKENISVFDTRYLTNVLGNIEDLDGLGYSSLEYFLSTIGSDNETFGKTITGNTFSKNRLTTWYHDIDSISPSTLNRLT